MISLNVKLLLKNPTCQHLESRRFSGPVDSEEAETLAALHPEGQVVDGRLAGAGVPLGQVANHLI